MKIETIVLDAQRNTRLTAYLQEVGGTYRKLSVRPAIMVIPGGGYQYCSMREGDPVATVFLKEGYQVFILNYAVGQSAVWPNPLDDYEMAMSVILEHASAWHIDRERIAIIGFSAGGHLAACAATMSVHRPRCAILGYGAFSGIEKLCPGAPDPTESISPQTSPCFLFASRTDATVPVKNTLYFTQALDRAGVIYEVHIYSHGPHGFSTGAGAVEDKNRMCTRAYGWVEDAQSFLEDLMGSMNDGILTPPIL